MASFTELRAAINNLDRRKVTGLGFICAVAVIWVVASFVVQSVEEDGGLDPLILTYIANSLFLLYLPLYELRRYFKEKPQTNVWRKITDEDDINYEPPPVQPKLFYTRKQTLAAAAVVAPIWFVAQYFFNMSLARTTVTSNTILSSTSSLWTFFLSVALLHEFFSLSKLGSIGLCIAGTALVTLADGKNSVGYNSVWGDLLCLVSAMLYASYTIAIRKQLPDDDQVSMTLFFGYVGAIYVVVATPVLGIFQAVGWVDFTKVSVKVFFICVGKGLFDNVLSDYLWARAILLIGPTVATLGLSMQVPIAIVAEILIKHPPWLGHAGVTALMLLGGCLVLAGFYGINMGSSGQEDKVERQTLDEEQPAGEDEELRPSTQQ